MKKLIICLIALLILSGCTVKTNITVNYDSSVNEDVYLLNSNESFGSNLKQIVDNKINSYKEILNIRKYKYSYEKGKELSGAKVYKKYDNICSYFKNSTFNQYVYKYIDCIDSDDYIEIKNSTEYIPYCPQCGNWPVLDNVEYKISLPVSAVEQNADEIDNNTYIWKYDKDTKNKNFYLKISKNDLKQYKLQYTEKLKAKNRMKKIIILGVIVVGILVIGIFALYMYNKAKKNRLDY